MKTPAFLTPLLLSNSRPSELNRDLLKNNNIIPSRESGLGFKMDPFADIFNVADNFKETCLKGISNSKEKISALKLQTMLKKSEDYAIIKAYKS